ncbi:MAG: GtrA family protein [Methylobacteriaceae bacterium]|jgi:putative flippase GtrA|nr:GtrA family protein [Methylobacteriaceae bacterium]
MIAKLRETLFSAQFLKFIGVGGTAAAVNFGARVVLNRWLSFDAAILTAYGVGMLTAFILNSIFVFPHATTGLTRQVLVFFGSNFAFLPVVYGATLLFAAGLDRLGAPFAHALAHGAALAVPMVASFLIYKFIGFKDA